MGKGYIAFVLDEVSQQMLVRVYRPKHANMKAHHVTLKYDVEEDEVNLVKEKLGFFNKDKPVVLVDDYLNSTEYGVDCVTVNIQKYFDHQKYRETGNRFHVTLSIKDGATAGMSNKFADKNPCELNPDYYQTPCPNSNRDIILTGNVEFIPFEEMAIAS